MEEVVKVSVNVPPFGHIDGPTFKHEDVIPLVHTGELLKFDHNGITVTVTLKGPGE